MAANPERRCARELANCGGVAERRPRGASDPDRRERIAQAAAAVVAERGVEGLTHRRVAERAQVPLGSTTYYFKTLDELLEISLQQAMEESIDELRRWAAGLTTKAEMIDAAVDLVVRRSSQERGRTVLYYELYVAALRRPALRRTCTEWVEAFTGVFSQHFDRATARALSAVLDGLILESTIAATPASPADVRDVLSCVLARA